MKRPTLRPGTEADLPRIRELYESMSLRLGVRMDIPDDLTKPPAMMLLVGELDGEIIGAAYVELVPEFGIIGNDPRFTAALLERAGLIYDKLAENKFRTARILVQAGVDGELGDQLEKIGMVEINDFYKHYVACLVRPEVVNG